MVASDKTGIRIEGLNGYHWAFMSNKAIVHEAQLSRVAQVVCDVMGNHRPRIWLSDGYCAQQGHGQYHQTCLAHLARDVAYALEASDDMVPLRLKLWLDKVFALVRNITSFATSALKAKKRVLENTLAEILATSCDCEIAVAADRTFQGQGMGTALMVHAIQKSVEFSEQIGCAVIVLDLFVDGDENAIRRRTAFYQSLGFRWIEKSDQPRRMYLSIKDAKAPL